MGLTHNQIIDRERKKYGKDWLTLTELHYLGYIFDLVAINLKTKEVEFLEVDFSSNTKEDKIKLAETIGKVRVFRPLGEKVQRQEYELTIRALANKLRIAVLEFLFDKGGATFSEICNALNLHPKYGGGHFGYHIQMIKKEDLIIKNKEGRYMLSEKGRKIIAFFRDLNKS